jgi:hypothetical protein
MSTDLCTIGPANDQGHNIGQAALEYFSNHKLPIVLV